MKKSNKITNKKSKKNNPHASGLHHNFPSPHKKDKAFGIASFVCGLMFLVPLFNILLGPLAIIFGVIQIRRIKQDPHRYSGQGFAIAGLTLGIICVIFTLIYYYSVLVDQNFIPGLNATALG